MTLLSLILSCCGLQKHSAAESTSSASQFKSNSSTNTCTEKANPASVLTRYSTIRKRYQRRTKTSEN